MGLDIHGMMIIGEKVVKQEYIGTITKYDENTGKPYSKQIKNHMYRFEDDNIKPPRQPLDDEDSERFQYHKLDSDGDYVIFGEQIGYTPSHRNGDCLEVIDRNQIHKAIEDYEKEFGRKAKIFCSTYASY